MTATTTNARNHVRVQNLDYGEFAYLIDRGFDHFSYRQYHIRRHPDKPCKLSEDGKRTLAPLLFGEVLHYRRDTSDTKEPLREIVLSPASSEPKEYYVDVRYAVEMEKPDV
jgi:hypothetical protein